MADSLARFQDAHDGGLGLVVAVCSDALVSLFVFGGGFFELDRIDLDAVFDVGEGGVEGECVSGRDFAAFRVFG